MTLGRLKMIVSPRCADAKFSIAANAATSAIAMTGVLRRRRPAPAASDESAAASTMALYAGFVVMSTTTRQAADQAATARALGVTVSQLSLAVGGGDGVWSAAGT